MISPELLRSYHHFAGVDEELLRRIAMIADCETHQPGDTIVRDGEPATKLYLIEYGEVDVGYEVGHKKFQPVDTLVAGELLVWSALVDPYVSTAIARCRTESQLVAINAPKLRKLCDEHPELGYILLQSINKVLADRLTNARVQLVGAG